MGAAQASALVLSVYSKAFTLKLGTIVRSKVREGWAMMRCSCYGVVKRSYCNHLRLDYLLITFHPKMCHPSCNTTTCQCGQLFSYQQTRWHHFYPFLVALNGVEHPQNKIVPVMTYVIVTTTSCFFTSFTFICQS